MRGYRFYEEPYGRGNCLAVVLETSSSVGDLLDAVVAVYEHPNSLVAVGPVARRYVERKCQRVCERRARAIHPELFRYLEENQP